MGLGIGRPRGQIESRDCHFEDQRGGLKVEHRDDGLPSSIRWTPCGTPLQCLVVDCILPGDQAMSL